MKKKVVTAAARRVLSTWAAGIVGVRLPAVLLLGGLLPGILLSGCATAPAPVATSSSGGIAVTVDPRVELVTIAQGLSDYPYQSVPLTLGYGRDVREHFAPVADHKLLDFIEERYPRGFGFEAPVTLALSLDPEGYSSYRHQLTPHYRERVGGAAHARRFAEVVASFARESDFQSFYRAHKEDYAAWTRQFASDLEEWKVRETLEAFFCTPLEDPTVVLTGMAKGPRFGALVGSAAYVMMGRTSERTLDGRLEPSFRVSAGTVRALYHEFAHSVVNPLIAAHSQEVAALSSLAEPIQEKLAPRGYPAWDVILSEHIVLAVETYLAFGDDERMREAALDRYEDTGFAYIRPIYDVVARYGDSRGGQGVDRGVAFAEVIPLVLVKLRTGPPE